MRVVDKGKPRHFEVKVSKKNKNFVLELNFNSKKWGGGRVFNIGGHGGRVGQLAKSQGRKSYGTLDATP